MPRRGGGRARDRDRDLACEHALKGHDMPVRGIAPSTAAGVLEGLVVRVDLAGLGVVLTGLLELGGEVLLCAEYRVESVHVEALRRRFALLGDELVDPGGE